MKLHDDDWYEAQEVAVKKVKIFRDHGPSLTAFTRKGLAAISVGSSSTYSVYQSAL